MNTIDIIVVILVVINGLIGAFKGFVWQALRVGGIVLGIFLARDCGPALAKWSQTWLEWDATGRQVVSYVVVFLGVYLLVSLLAHVFRKLIDRAHLASADRSLGFLLGSVKGLLLVWVAFYFIVIFYALLPAYAHTQLSGNVEQQVPPSKAYQVWDRWVRQHLDDVMPGELASDLAAAKRQMGN